MRVRRAAVALALLLISTAVVGSAMTLDDSPIAARGAPELGQKVFRVWGDEAGAWGKSWTRVDPRTVPGYREAAGLPGQNAGRFISEGRLTSTEGVLSRRALPLEGQPGGLDELVVPDPRSQIELQRVLGLNPEF
jgi:hypothetical protein